MKAKGEKELEKEEEVEHSRNGRKIEGKQAAAGRTYECKLGRMRRSKGRRREGGKARETRRGADEE